MVPGPRTQQSTSIGLDFWFKVRLLTRGSALRFTQDVIRNILHRSGLNWISDLRRNMGGELPYMPTIAVSRYRYSSLSAGRVSIIWFTTRFYPTPPDLFQISVPTSNRDIPIISRMASSKPACKVIGSDRSGSEINSAIMGIFRKWTD